MSDRPVPRARAGVEGLFAAIESRDLRRVEAALSPDVIWQNVPHPAVVGRTAVLTMLADILRWSDEVRWDVVSLTDRSGGVRVDRVDRFRIDGDEHAVRCVGDVEVDPAGAVSSVRDQVDLEEWRARIEPVYARMRARPANDIVARHCRAVRRREVAAMAADYALDAVLVRGETIHRGWAAIADYFDGAVARLSGREVVFGPITDDDLEISDGVRRAAVRWQVVDDDVVVASGRDTFDCDDGFITRQVVELDDGDF